MSAVWPLYIGILQKKVWSRIVGTILYDGMDFYWEP